MNTLILRFIAIEKLLYCKLFLSGLKVVFMWLSITNIAICCNKMQYFAFIFKLFYMLLKIKEIRISKKMNQDELALKTGLSKRMIIDYEKEIKDIPLKKLQLIANAFEVSIYDLIDVDVVKQYSKEKETINLVNEESSEYNIMAPLNEAQKKTIAILEREVQDLRNDKQFLKEIIETKLSNVS